MPSLTIPINSIREKISGSLAPTSLTETAWVFIDDRLADQTILRKALRANVELRIVDRHENGFEAIAQCLEEATSTPGICITSIHLLGHATCGNLWLGDTAFNQHSMVKHQAQIAAWSNTLAADATIAIYGCQFAAHTLGSQAVAQLNAMLQRPIFAANHDVGASQVGGLWSLNVRWAQGRQTELNAKDAIAPIELAFDRDRLKPYPHRLAPPNLVYGVNVSGEIFTVDLADGSTQVKAQLPFDSFGLARSYNLNDPTDPGLLYFSGTGDDTDIRLGTWNPVTLEVVELASIDRSLGTSDPSDDLTGSLTRFTQHQDGRLIAFPGQASKLYAIDPVTSKASLLTTVELNGEPFPSGGGDIVFDLDNPDLLYVLRTRTNSDIYELYRVDLSNLPLGADPANSSKVSVSAELIGSITSEDGGALSAKVAGSLGLGENGDFFITSLKSEEDPLSQTGLYRLDVQDIKTTTNGTLVAEFIGPLGRQVNDFASFPTPTAQIDLQVTKDDGEDQVRVGDRVTYTITVTNPSEPPPGFVAFSIEGVEVIDTVSPGLLDVTWSAEFTAGSGRFPTPADQHGRGSVDSTIDLGIGATVTYQVTGIVGPNTPDNLTNTVLVELPPGFNLVKPADSAPEDTVLGTDVTRVLPAEVDLQVSQLNIDRTLEPGETLSYTITVTNPSSLALDGVMVRDRLPDFLQNATWTRTQANGTIVNGSGNIDEAIAIAARASVTYTAQYRDKKRRPFAVRRFEPPEGCPFSRFLS